jgi:signal transduction histidine kinase/HAMP domain-containing protein
VTLVRQFVNILYPRVGTRVVTPFLLAVIAVAGIAVFTVTNLVTGSIQERFKNQLFESGNAASNALFELERDMLEGLRSAVFTIGVPQSIVDRDIDSLHSLLLPIAANDSIEELIAFSPRGEGIYRLARIADENGVVYTQIDPLDVSGWDGAMRVVNGEQDESGDKFADLVERGDETMLFISAPVSLAVGDEKQIVGGIAIAFRVETLAQRSAAQALSSVALLSRSGDVMGSTFRSIDRDEIAISSETADLRLRQIQVASPIVEMTLDATPYQLLYAPFQVRGETVGLLSVGLPSNYIVEQSGVSRNIVALLFGVLFVVVTGVGIWVARSIVQPVSRLVETTRAIMGGDLKRRVRLKGNDELAELGESVDSMTEDLVQRNFQIAELYEEQLQVTVQREAVFTSISDAVIVQSGDGSILQLNVAAYRLMDAVARDPEEQKRFDGLLHHEADVAEAGTLIELAGGYYNFKRSSVSLPGGEIIGRVTTFTDLSAILRAERLKDELILQMSHELRTPLAALRGNVDLIRIVEKKNLSEKGVSFLKRSTDQLSILERMLNQVVDVSSIITNRFHIDRRLVDLNVTVKAKTEAWQARFMERGLTLELVMGAHALCVLGDQERLEQVVDHLLRNAFSYTLTGGARIELGADDSDVVLMVSDTGVGIKADEIEHVFERMYRGSASHAGPTDSRGMGLGLYLAQHIVELHTGTISLQSSPGQGTRVSVRLPIAAQAVVEPA